MKKSILYISLIPFMALFATSCDLLDFERPGYYPEDAIYESRDAFDNYTMGFYALIRSQSQMNNNHYFDAYSDIMKHTGWYDAAYNRTLLTSNTLTANSNGSLGSWDYSRITRQNEYLLNAHRAGHFGEDFLKVRIAEVRFIRAYNYFVMARVYGGVVLRTVEDGVLDSVYEQNKPRATEEETYGFIISELKAAAEDLPERWADSEWYGRATKNMAYGLLSRVALYAKDWQTANAAADSVIKSSYAGLEDNYTDVFYKTLQSNKEAILAVDFAGQIAHDYDKYFRPKGDDSENLPLVVPTAELVDSYEWEDGTPYDWDTWQDKVFADGSSPAHPWDKRDPRLDVSILYHGAQWIDRTIAVQTGGADESVTFVRGVDPRKTVTGYYVRKYLSQDSPEIYKYDRSHQYDLLIRYAEVLLNKAEALAETDYASNAAAALEELNKVRTRAGMPGKELADAPDKDAFMALVRHERVVELAFEGFRYWDLRRWRLAVDVINGKRAHGVKVTVENGVPSYERVEVDAGMDRIFQERYYLLSIPQSERDTNTAIGANNPGW